MRYVLKWHHNHQVDHQNWPEHSNHLSVCQTHDQDKREENASQKVHANVCHKNHKNHRTFETKLIKEVIAANLKQFDLIRVCMVKVVTLNAVIKFLSNEHASTASSNKIPFGGTGKLYLLRLRCCRQQIMRCAIANKTIRTWN